MRYEHLTDDIMVETARSAGAGLGWLGTKNAAIARLSLSKAVRDIIAELKPTITVADSFLKDRRICPD